MAQDPAIYPKIEIGKISSHLSWTRSLTSARGIWSFKALPCFTPKSNDLAESLGAMIAQTIWSCSTFSQSSTGYFGYVGYVIAGAARATKAAWFRTVLILIPCSSASRRAFTSLGLRVVCFTVLCHATWTKDNSKEERLGLRGKRSSVNGAKAPPSTAQLWRCQRPYMSNLQVWAAADVEVAEQEPT